MYCHKKGYCGEKRLAAGGEGGIRTLDTLSRMPDFESGTFNQLCHLSGSADYSLRTCLSKTIGNPYSLIQFSVDRH